MTIPAKYRKIVPVIPLGQRFAHATKSRSPVPVWDILAAPASVIALVHALAIIHVPVWDILPALATELPRVAVALRSINIDL